MPHPFVENGYQELSPAFGFDSAFRDKAAILCVKRTQMVAFSPTFIGNLQQLGRGTLNDRNELNEMCLQLVAEEAVHLQRMFDVGSMNSAENIEFDPVL